MSVYELYILCVELILKKNTRYSLLWIFNAFVMGGRMMIWMKIFLCPLVWVPPLQLYLSCWPHCTYFPIAPLWKHFHKRKLYNHVLFLYSCSRTRKLFARNISGIDKVVWKHILQILGNVLFINNQHLSI